MGLWSGPPIDPTLDPGTQSAILAIRSRRLRLQRRFARMLVSAVVMALLGAWATSLFSGGSSSPPAGPAGSNAVPANSVPSGVNQQVQELNDLARQLQQAR